MPTQGGHHWLEREDTNGVTVVRFVMRHLRGEEACREVFALLFALIDEVGRSRLVLNLGRVESLDSSAIGKLILLNHKAQATGGRLALCCLGPAVNQALVAMHLTGTFAVHDEECEAVQFVSLPSLPESGSTEAEPHFSHTRGGAR
jgi:anti-anti-sigma factor